MKYCIVLAAEGCMIRIEREFVHDMPTKDDITWWEKHYSDYSEYTYTVINVFPVSNIEG